MIDRSHVFRLMVDFGISNHKILVSHKTFRLVSYDWVFQNWTAYATSLPKALKREVGGVVFPKHVQGGHNCEICAMGLQYQCLVSNCLSTPDEEKSTCAVGSIWFNRDNGKPHCINVFIDPSENIRFYEAEYGHEVTLSKPELSSVFYGNIL